MNSEFVSDLPIKNYPRQSFERGEKALSADDRTDRFFLVLEGALRENDSGKVFRKGDMVSPLQFFGTTHYDDEIVALARTQVIAIPRQDIQDKLNQQSPMTWGMARMIAIEKHAERMGMIQ